MKIAPQNQTVDLIFLIDKSGSMYGSEEDIIGGFNSFIERETKKDLNTNVTTIFFAHDYEVLYKRKAIEDVKKLTCNEYMVGGSTALLDAIGRTITSMEREIDNNVLFVIMTDGYENSSCEYSKAQISNMIANHNWEFIYIGADIDSYSEAGRIGIRKSRVANYEKSARGVDKLYCSVENAMDCMRSNRSLDEGDWKKELNEYD
ncbi:vWA domain-containing protein [Methanobrevibacter sp.]|uniref:vWA domain-containing protein n=1 Tax=Methanobrevibacter sp. TaxID=66852 RepID=UPI00389042A5